MNFVKKIKLFLLFFIMILIILSSCFSSKLVTRYDYSSPIAPQWFNYLSSRPNSIAVMPFEAYDYKTKSLARKLESQIRSKLKDWGEYSIIERHQLNRVLSEQSFSLTGLSDQQLIEAGKMLATNIILFGVVTDYDEEENYIENIEKVTYAADKYSRIVTTAFNIRIVSIETGEIIYDEEKSFNSRSVGYKNIRKLDETRDNDDLGKGLVNLIDNIGETLSNEKQKLPKMESFSSLREKCINQAVNTFFPELVTYRKCYKEEYKVDSKGNRKLKSRNYYTNSPAYFVGVGFRFEVINGSIMVIKVFPNTPASKAGLHLNDKIIKIDNKPCLGITQDQAIRRFKGSIGKALNITVMREGESNPIEFSMIRDLIPY